MATRRERWMYWRKIVREHAASGLTQVAFCRRHGVKVKSLQRWRSRLRTELQLEPIPELVEVVVEARPVQPVAAPARDIALFLGEDCVLHVAPGTPTDYVAELVGSLRRGGAC